MKKLELGKSSIKISPIIMGMWQAGKKYWTDIDDKAILSSVATALDAGITTFDTAEDYGDGYSEQMLGQGLKGQRDKAFILSKVSSNHLKAADVVEACHRSLKNLQTDYLDLYQIHWPAGSWGSEATPIEETMAALNRLKAEGKIRSIGVSNFSLEQLEEARQFGQIDSLQSPYSIYWRHVEKKLLPYCKQHDITFLAYSPLAQGLLSGKFKAGHKFAAGDNRRQNKLVEKDTFPKVLENVATLNKIAKRRELTLSQLALAWIIYHDNTAAIAGVRDAKQIADNAKAGWVTLSTSEMRDIDEVSKPIFEKWVNDPIPWFWTP